MKKEDCYWIIGAVIGTSIANYIVRKQKEKETTQKLNDRLAKTLDNMFKENEVAE